MKTTLKMKTTSKMKTASQIKITSKIKMTTKIDPPPQILFGPPPLKEFGKHADVILERSLKTATRN